MEIEWLHATENPGAVVVRGHFIERDRPSAVGNPGSGFKVDGIQRQITRRGSHSVRQTRVPDPRHATELIVKLALQEQEIGTLEFENRGQIESRLVTHLPTLEQKNLDPGASQLAHDGLTGWTSANDAQIGEKYAVGRDTATVRQHAARL
jgi:hypothetical protein